MSIVFKYICTFMDEILAINQGYKFVWPSEIEIHKTGTEWFCTFPMCNHCIERMQKFRNQMWSWTAKTNQGGGLQPYRLISKSRVTRGRCYDHNFLRFLPIFVKKFGVFLKNQCYDKKLHNLALIWVENANFFTFFWRKYFKNHNIGPRLGEFSPIGRLFCLGCFFLNLPKCLGYFSARKKLCINCHK
jgi:hypothetical protein